MKPSTDLSTHENLGFSLNPMEFLANQGKEQIQSAAKYVVIGGTAILLGYSVFRNPGIIVKWATLPLDAAQAAMKFVKGGINLGTQATTLGSSIAPVGVPLIIIGGIAYYFKK